MSVGIDSIYTLHQRGTSQRWITRELGIDRESVARQQRLRPPEPNSANALVGLLR
jgi:hypothetical protein